MTTNVIKNVHGCTKTIEGKTKVFLLYEDVLNKLGLVSYQKVPNQTVVTSIDNEDQYSYKPIIDYNKVNIYMAIAQVANTDPSVIQDIPNPLLPEHYIPSELAVELSRQCRNRMFEMELIQQIIPGFEPQQSHIKHNNTAYPLSLHNPFEGDATDLSNAYRFYNQYKDTIKYIQDLDQFIIYKSTWNDSYGRSLGGIWSVADKHQFEPLLANFKKQLTIMAQTKQEREIAETFGKLQYTNRAISKIKGIEDCIIFSSELNTYPDLLNVKNGIVNLRTGNLIPANPSLYFTRQAPVVYDPYARSFTFEQFIEQILPDSDTRIAVLRYLGYCLTGETNAQKALFIVGSGANGKSTLLNVMTKLLGLDYATSIPISFFSEHSLHYKSGATPERAMLIGKRFVQVDEIKAGEVLDAGEFKLLTGSDMIPCRGLYKSMSVFSPTHKFIFSGNFLPELKNNNDGGLNRRLMIAEFPRKFNPDQTNPYLLDMLTSPESLSGILNLLVHESIMYYKEKLYESDAMTDIKDEYISGLAKIVRSILAYDSDSYVLTSDLENVVNKIMFPNRLKQGQLKQIMSKLGYEPVKITKIENRNKWAYQGLKFINK